MKTSDRYKLRRDDHNCFSIVDVLNEAPARFGSLDLSELLSTEASEMLQSLNQLYQFQRRFHEILEN
mgnify:FL=1